MVRLSYFTVLKNGEAGDKIFLGFGSEYIRIVLYGYCLCQRDIYLNT